jgi:PTS system beta-glucosides-specific IIC component
MSRSSGLLTLPAYLGEPLSNFVFAVLTCVISAVLAFVLTLVFGFKYPKEDSAEVARTANIGAKAEDNTRGVQNGSLVTPPAISTA